MLHRKARKGGDVGRGFFKEPGDIRETALELHDHPSQLSLHLLGRGLGERIDAFPRVVRFNCYHIDGLEADAGIPRGPERLLALMLRGGPYGLSLEKLQAEPHGIALGALEGGRLPQILATEGQQLDLAPSLLTGDVPRLRAALAESSNGGLLLIGRRNVRSNNSWMHNVRALTKGKNRCTLLVHPDDAARLGLADGARAVLQRWPQLKPVLSHVKGLEQSAYDGRAALSMALAYGTSDIGAHHARAWTIAKEIEMGSEWGIEEKVDLVIYHQSVRPLFDMLGVCRLPWIELGFSEDHYVEFYHAVTGVRLSIEQMLERSRAIYDLTRIINTQRGATRQDDYPPPRCFELPVQTGPHKGDVVDPEQYEKALQLYYKKRGWDADGNPPDSTKELFNDPLE